jgi:hypothetical protein
MATPSPGKRVVTKRPPEARREVNGVMAYFTQFVQNRKVIADLSLANDGDKKAGTPGLKKWLLSYTMKNGEVDEKGSFFFELPQPVSDGRDTFARIKAQRAGGDKYLNVDKARTFLAKKELLNQVEKRVVSLKLDEEQSEAFDHFLATIMQDVEPGSETPLLADGPSLDQDSLLALYQRKVITEKQLDALYDTAEPTWSFITLKN